MAQHFLRSRAARSISVSQVSNMTDAEAEAKFIELRWFDNGGQPRCPHCGSVRVYTCPRRNGANRYRCRDCHRDFSVTSGTLFAGHKKSLKTYLLAIVVFCNDVKGKAALAMIREIDTEYKTAFILAHKLREAMWQETAHLRSESGRIGGPGKLVQIDSVRIKASYRKKRLRKDKIHQAIEQIRKKEAKKKDVHIVALRQVPRKHDPDGDRIVTITEVFKSEHAMTGWVQSRIATGTTVHADESSDWNDLDDIRGVRLRRINHSLAYMEGGISINADEWLFTRIRRSAHGHHHHIRGPYLHRYAQEMAWRDDHRRDSNGAQVDALLRLALNSPPSPIFRGYWQRRGAKTGSQASP
jgi:transposase-like protein